MGVFVDLQGFSTSGTGAVGEGLVSDGAAMVWVLDPAVLGPRPDITLYGAYSSAVTYTVRLRTNTDPTSSTNAAGTLLGEVVLPPASYPAPFELALGPVDLPAMTLLKLTHQGNLAIMAWASVAVLVEDLPQPPPALLSTLVIQGGDLDVVADLPGQSFKVATGLRNLGNALARRLTTPRGGLFYDPNYGLDVRAYLNAGMTPQQLAQVQGDVPSEVIKEARIDNPTVTVVQNLAAARMEITIACELAEGPFEFIFGVTNLTVKLLRIDALS